jgi:signal transduction histidine kinase/CheY-like chemotaxis protein
MIVVASERCDEAIEPEPAPALLRYLGELLGPAEPGSPHAILSNLARHFGARAAGVAYPSRTEPATCIAGGGADVLVDFPWHDNQTLLEQLTRSSAALSVNDAAGNWLLCCAPMAPPNDPAVLWLNAADSHRWSESEKACLVLAGQTLWRIGVVPERAERRFEGAAERDERLHRAAHVASRLSHDFGNLLTSILGFSELALNQVAQGTVAHRYLSEVWDVARGGAEWLKNLNFFCRRSRPEVTPCGLPGALAEEEARLGPQTSAPWQANLPDDLPALACDAESLRHALRQVLDNAREATAGGGIVGLAARAVELNASQTKAFLGNPPAGRFVEIVVTDSGPGVSADVRDRLWNELFLSSKPRHRGLGLMMTYGIVRCFGGGLQIAPGATGGTEVRLLFPAAPDPENTGPAPILVVDDDPQLLAEARRVLEPAGYRVRVASSAAEALVLHQTASEPFELILVAAHLPHMSGVEVARRMRLRDPNARFLFLHAPSDPRLPRDALLTPAALVHKPFTPLVLLQTVAVTLRRGRQHTDGP